MPSLPDSEHRQVARLAVAGQPNREGVIWDLTTLERMIPDLERLPGVWAAWIVGSELWVSLRGGVVPEDLV